jgi:tetratricopeptide (TPR) repeat protein
VEEHPTPAELEGFVWNRLTAERVKAVTAHIVRGCVSCRSMVARSLCALMESGEPPEVPALSPEEDAAYDAALERAFSFALHKERERLEKGKREALALLSDPSLESLPEIPPHLCGIPMFEALLERSWSLRHESPEHMVRLADWARLLSERLPVWQVEDLYAIDYRCRAWIELGNAHRVADNLDEAELALGWATDLFLQGTRDEILAARLFDVQASLYASRRRFDLAETALDLVFVIHRRRGDEPLAGRALLSKGVYVGYQGRAEEAVELINQGLLLLDASRDTELVATAIHNKARFLMDCGRFREARFELFHLYRQGPGPGGRVNELKVRWLEGQIHAGLGDLDRAEKALRDVHQEFEAMDLGYKAALAGLELGAVLLRQDRLDDACDEILEAAKVFVALRIGRETGASILLLKETCELKMADPVLLDHVIRLLHGLEGSAKNPEPPTKA